MWPAGKGDDNRRFLADLRALRDTAALEWDELAARTHYPSDVLKEAENGPSLPGLPVLAAYVRACDGDVLEWEERWRRLGFDVRGDPSLPVRPAGASPAAVAGARAGVSVAPPDAYDPERIRAALRGSHGRLDRGGRQLDTGWGADALPSAGAGWDDATTELNGALANGNHHLSQPDPGPADAVVIETPDAARAEAIRRDPFSADWLQDSELTSPPEPGPAETAAPDSWFTPRETADREEVWPAADTEADAGAWFTPPERTDRGQVPLELAAGGQTIPRASWPAPAEIPADDPPGAAERTTPILAEAAVAAAAATAAAPTIAESAVPPGPVVPPSPVVPPGESRPDRLYPVRLLVIIVAAALIGSILVLLLR